LGFDGIAFSREGDSGAFRKTFRRFDKSQAFRFFQKFKDIAAFLTGAEATPARCFRVNGE
jgi:hypothetical protein